MQKTKIEWTDFVWNPIKGICPVGCFYCYARRMYKRFGWPTKISWDGRVPILSNKKPSKIFVCSTIEMFHPQIPKEWRDTIFTIIEADYNKKHIFQILTKFPQNIDREMPDNVWLGVTVDGQTGYLDRNRLDVFQDIKANIKFISYEPILREVGFEEKDKIDWLILGALTGYSYKIRHRLSHVVYLQILVHSYQRDGTKIFLKDNLKEIWGENLIQELPE